jgi:hypothetical protein
LFNIYSNSNKISYGIKKYIVDTIKEISNLPANIIPGSSAFIIEDSSTYILNNQKQWIKIKSASSEDEPTSKVLDGGVITIPIEEGES